MINVEFLGCRYSSEVMLQIDAMASDLLKQFRSTSKTNIRRTLVSADVATASKYRKTNEGEDISQAKRKFGVSFVKESTEKSTEIKTRPSLQSSASADHRKYYNLLAKVVGYIITNEDGAVNFANSISKTIQQHKDGQFLEQVIDNAYTCYYNGTLLVSVKGPSQKKARSDGVQKLFALLKNYCPFLIRKALCCAQDEKVVHKDGKSKPSPNSNGTRDVDTFQSNKLGADNIGFRMLKALGWKEGESTNNSVIDPIGLSVKIGRSGLGSDADKVGKHLNVQYFRDMIRSYLNSGTEFDLVFSKEFTKEERAELHKIAQGLKLKSKSAGKDDERYLIVSRKTNLTPIEVVEKVVGGDQFYNSIWILELPELKDYQELKL